MTETQLLEDRLAELVANTASLDSPPPFSSQAVGNATRLLLLVAMAARGHTAEFDKASLPEETNRAIVFAETLGSVVGSFLNTTFKLVMPGPGRGH